MSIVRADAKALVGVLAVLAGHAAVGDVTPHAVAHLQRRLAADLGLRTSASLDDMLNMVNQRLRRALGEPA